MKLAFRKMGLEPRHLLPKHLPVLSLHEHLHIQPWVRTGPNRCTCQGRGDIGAWGFLKSRAGAWRLDPSAWIQPLFKEGECV